MNTEKIVITKEQETELKWAMSNVGKEHIRVNHLMNFKLDLVTSARLVSGEDYEVEREFEVGDIVYDTRDGGLRQVVATRDDVAKFHLNSVDWVNQRKERYELVGKVTI